MTWLRGLPALILCAVVISSLPLPAHAQAPAPIVLDETIMPADPNTEDIRLIGRGRTGVAWNPRASAVLTNPALLGTPRTTVEFLGVGASLPTATFNSIDFLSRGSTITQLKTGNFFKQIRQGIDVILNGNSTAAQRAAAAAQINGGLGFANEFQDKVLGTSENPKMHGVTVIPSIQGQVGNIGFSLAGNLHSAFFSIPSPELVELYRLRLPADFNALPDDQKIALANQLLNALGTLLTPDPTDPLGFKLNYLEAVPTTFAAAYLDVVGTVGYGYALTRDLQLGAALKLVNRRFSTKFIDPDHYNGLLKEARRDFNTSSTGVTLDLGAAYLVRSTGTRLGVVLQNIIPLPKITSMAEFTLVVQDQAGATFKQRFQLPVTIKTPFLASAGATQPIVTGLTASLDWSDIAAQDTISYATYFERFRLGTEYRYETSPGGFAAAARLGLAYGRFSGGLGLDFWRYFSLDGAYAYDALLATNAWFAGFRFGF